MAITELRFFGAVPFAWAPPTRCVGDGNWVLPPPPLRRLLVGNTVSS